MENSPTKIKTRPAGVKDLPLGLHGFQEDVPPLYIEWIGRCNTPWSSPPADVLVDIVDQKYQRRGCVFADEKAARNIVSDYLLHSIAI